MKADYIGIGSALVCTVHCICTPIILLTFQGWSWWHQLSYVFLFTSILSIYQVYRQVHELVIKYVLILSLLLLTMSILLEESISWMTEIGYLAALGLIIGHSWNLWNHRSLFAKSK